MNQTKNRSRTYLLRISSVLAVLLIAMQLYHPAINNYRADAEIQAPPEVKAILKNACYDCHSNATDLRWYDQIAPVYWQVAAHVQTGRKALNFSQWQNMPQADQKAKLWESVNQIIAAAMPLKSYTIIHRQAVLTPAELTVLKAYVSSLAAKSKPRDTSKLKVADNQLKLKKKDLAQKKLPVAMNGIAYLPDYKNWQVISTTDRFDNGTMRVIFGNDIAVKAVKENRTNPWPDGTIFAKVAWDQLEDAKGNITPGAFKQVEYMIKDHQKYASTNGWGFARFKTENLIPYGKTALFATECINCHRPMKEADFVFTQPIRN